MRASIRIALALALTACSGDDPSAAPVDAPTGAAPDAQVAFQKQPYADCTRVRGDEDEEVTYDRWGWPIHHVTYSIMNEYRDTTYTRVDDQVVQADIRVTHDAANGVDPGQEVATYDAHQHLVREAEWVTAADGTPTEVGYGYDLVHDAQGMLLERTRYDLEGVAPTDQVTTYDACERPVRVEYVREGEVMSVETVENTYRAGGCELVEAASPETGEVWRYEEGRLVEYVGEGGGVTVYTYACG